MEAQYAIKEFLRLSFSIHHQIDRANIPDLLSKDSICKKSKKNCNIPFPMEYAFPQTVPSNTVRYSILREQRT